MFPLLSMCIATFRPSHNNLYIWLLSCQHLFGGKPYGNYLHAVWGLEGIYQYNNHARYNIQKKHAIKGM